MKLRRNIPKSSSNLNVDIKSCLVKYVQSYLKWLSIQNPDFIKTLNNEELANYLFHSIDLPIWFQFLLKTNTFKIIMEVNNYISKYKKEVALMDNELPIIPLNENVLYTPVGYPVYKEANASQKEYLEELCERLKFNPHPTYTEIDYQLCIQIQKFNEFLRKDKAHE